MAQLKSSETAKLRIFKQKRQPAPVKKPDSKELAKKSVLQQAKPAPRPSLTAEIPYQNFNPQYQMMMQQEMMNTYMMFCYSNPWYFYHPFQ